MKPKLHLLHCRKRKQRNRQNSQKEIASGKGDKKVIKEECCRMELNPSKTKS